MKIFFKLFSFLCAQVKCNTYWPSPDKRVEVHGKIRVQLQEELYLSDHTIRTFSLQKERGDERIVKQFHYTAWPDYGVPEHPTPLLRFIHKVETDNPVKAGPMIVHCRWVQPLPLFEISGTSIIMNNNYTYMYN